MRNEKMNMKKVLKTLKNFKFIPLINMQVLSVNNLQKELTYGKLYDNNNLFNKTYKYRSA